MKFKEAKVIVRNYLQTAYTDRDLVRALDHARAGKLAFRSCCCCDVIEDYPSQDGMTLRDYFAAATLTAILSPANDLSYEDAAKNSYIMANAMLAEREKQK